MIDVSVVTATYNEEDNIGYLIEDIEKILDVHNLQGEIIVVDDSPTDDTAQVVRKKNEIFNNIKLIKREKKLGIGNAFGRGLKESKGDIIVTMDADFSHPPSSIYQMVKEARKGNFVVGSRFLVRSVFLTKKYKKIGTILLNLWIRIILKTGIKDYTNGYMAVSKENIEKILAYGMEHNIKPFEKMLYVLPIAAIAKILEIPFCEVPASYFFRKRGKTKVHLFDGLKTVFYSMAYTLQLYYIIRKERKK
jgi:glycosyltransferase involved in cell wall biosynthesis